MYSHPAIGRKTHPEDVRTEGVGGEMVVAQVKLSKVGDEPEGSILNLGDRVVSHRQLPGSENGERSHMDYSALIHKKLIHVNDPLP